MIRWELPSANSVEDVHREKALAKLRRHPGVVEPPPFVGTLPIGSAIAPPRVELLGLGNEMPRGVDPIRRRTQILERRNLDGRMGDDPQKLFVRPNVIRKRRDVEIPDEDPACAVHASPAKPPRHIAKKLKLVRKLGILVGVGHVSPGRRIDIMKLDATRKRREDVTAIGTTVPSFRSGVRERHSRKNGYPVIPLLPRDELMYVPKLTKPRGGEKLVDAFDFLQTKDVRLMLPENAQNRPNPKPHRVDVPADNSQNGTPNVAGSYSATRGSGSTVPGQS